ncbi:MAG: TolC family protein [Candidatus Marinamargulisbacteria bacterium]
MIHLHRWFFIWICLTLPLLSAQPYPVSAFINDLIHKNTKQQQLQSQRQSTQFAYDRAWGVTDWHVMAELSNAHIEPYQTSVFSTPWIDTRTASLSLNRPLLTTGGTLQFTLQQQKVTQPLTAFNGASFNESLFYQNSIGVHYTQPLLAGFLGESLQFPLLVATTNAQQVVIQSDDAFEDFLMSQLFDYIDWTLANELAELSFSRLQLANESLAQTQQRVKVNVSEKIDFLRAKYAQQHAQQQWKQAHAQLKSMQFKIAAKFDDPSLRQALPQFNLYDTVYIKKPEHIVVNKLRALKAMALNEPVLERQLCLRKSHRNGQLNLRSGVDFLGGDTMYQSSLAHTDHNATIALQYRRDLSDTEAAAHVKEQTETLVQFKLKQDQRHRDLEADILALYILIDEYQSILALGLDQIASAIKKADAEATLYAQGRQSIDMLIQAQDTVLNAKTNYAQKSATYQKQVLRYFALTDTLLSTYEVSL